MFRFFRRYRFWFMIGTIATLVLARAGLIMIFGVEGRVSEDNYYRIVNGMTAQEVEDILGTNYGETGGIEKDGVRWALRSWSGPKVFILVTFSDGKVNNKSIMTRAGNPPRFLR